MKSHKFWYRGSEINKVQFSEIEDDLLYLGMNVDYVFNLLADKNEFVYVSNGFIKALKCEKEELKGNEWHHYFVKTDSHFEAKKLKFA